MRTAIFIAALLVASPGFADVELRPSEGASQAFWDHWSDGKAELNGYRVTTPRYGQLRDGVQVLIYVTEEMNKKTLIKDDTGTVPAKDKEVVLKLNNSLEFQTGIYPYSVMTSVFSPVGSSGRERFAPAKISFSAQEWCGHVFMTMKPEVDRVEAETRSYFSVEGDKTEVIKTEPFTLYEDALLIQLRELDGPFEGGGDWSGWVVPTSWNIRRAHEPVAPEKATITRTKTSRDGTPVNRFVLKMGSYERTFDVEEAMPHRLLGWSTSDGVKAELLGSTRLTYWGLGHEGGEAFLTELGLTPDLRVP